MLEVLRSGRLSLGPMGERFEREFAAWLGVEDAVTVSSGTTALHLGVRVLGWGGGRRGRDQPLQLRRLGQLPALRGRAPVFSDVDQETLDLDPAAAAAAVGERTAGLLPVHIFGYPAAMPELEALAARARPRHPRGRLRGARRGRLRGPQGRRPRQPRHLRLLRQQADDDGGGGDDRPPRPRRGRRACARERNQGRAVDMGWLDHDRLGFNYRLSDLAAALGVAQVEKLDSLLERARDVARDVRGAAGRRSRGCGRRSPARGSRASAAGSSTPCRLPQGADRDATIARLAERGVASKAYLPCIHLFPHLRELGYREGQFPVAEAAAARLAGAAVLPGDERGAGGARLPGARRGPRPGPLTA